ncbi:MAG: type II secretion system protein [Candidatus Nanogingivalis sp.]
MNKINTKKGFTIIEVVLVLAIAGLIFLMVFLALPALQRNQRDTQRKNDLSRVQSAISSFQTNNRGRIPTITGNTLSNNFVASYLTVGGDTFQDPNGPAYQFQVGDPTWNSAAATQIQYAVGSRCNGEALQTGQGNNKVALRMALEGGGIYCLNN